MLDEQCYEYAGNLLDELQESEKLISNNENESDEIYSTHTRGCGTFLTIYCC